MKQKWIWLILALAALLLSGCNTTVYDLYQLPKRSQQFTNLQSVIEQAMVGLQYSAPVSGENQQTVQMADLDGDGNTEYLVFAKDSDTKPLRIFVFAQEDGQYRLLDTVECSGTAFEQVEYLRMNDRPGYEVVVGRQVSDQVLRSVSVYTLRSGELTEVLGESYARLITCDLNSDACAELLLLKPGQTNSDNGIAQLFSIQDNTLLRSPEINMSASADKIKRLILGRLQSGEPAAFVASDVDGSAIVTDVYAQIDGQFTNVAFSNDSGTGVQTLRNYYVYADDIDNDGILELPSLIPTKLPEGAPVAADGHIIRWYSMHADGSEHNKLFTYHNFAGGWYLQLNHEQADRITVIQIGSSFTFCLWNGDETQVQPLFSLYVLTGQKREELAAEDNRFVVHRGESTVYAAKLEGLSSAYEITKDSLKSAFHLILQDWKTGET